MRPGALLALVGAYVGCGLPTQTIVVLEADGDSRERAAFLQVRVCNNDGRSVLDDVAALSGDDPDVALPARIPLNPRESGERSFALLAELVDAEGEVFAVQRAIAGFEECERVRVTRAFTSECWLSRSADACGADETCVAGTCEPRSAVDATFRGETPPCDPSDPEVDQCLAPEECRWGCAGLGCDVPVHLATGPGHACVALRSGNVMCWGQATSGKVGANRSFQRSCSENCFPQPAPVDAVEGARAVSAGLEHSCASTPDAVYCWGIIPGGSGGSIPRPLMDTGGATALSSGMTHGCAIRASAGYCWGAGAAGRLGNGGASDVGDPPARVVGLESMTSIAAGWQFSCGIDDVVEVVAGRNHACAITPAGELHCWGCNQVGQVDPSSAERLLAPRAILDASDPVVQADAWSMTCATRRSGEVVCWGANWGDACGAASPGDRAMRVIDPLFGASQVGVGQGFICAIVGQEVLCAGDNGAGELGRGSGPSSPDYLPVLPMVE